MLADRLFGDFSDSAAIGLIATVSALGSFSTDGMGHFMWRAFFFACGIMLIVLGFECIVVNRFWISHESGLTRVVKKVFGNENGPSATNLQAANLQGGVAGVANGYGQATSQFGPTRFHDSPFLNASADRRQAVGSPFTLPNQNSGLALNLPGAERMKIVKTEDWMPWSLIAAGTIITLYTHSLRQGYQSN